MNTWRCTVCGFVASGTEPPERCPVCSALASAFEATDGGTEAPPAEAEAAGASEEECQMAVVDQLVEDTAKGV